MRNGPFRFTGRRVHLEDSTSNFKAYTEKIRVPPEFDPQEESRQYEVREDY